MIVYVESYWGDKLIFGKVRSAGQLRYRMMAVLKEVTQKDFISIFCVRYNFEVLSCRYKNQGIEVDYTMDLDICHVYKPIYRSHEYR